MASIGIEFLIEQHGAAKVRAELDRLTASTQKATAAAKPMRSQIAELGGAITGPLGVATGLALATKRLIDFGRANATTAQQTKAFAAFDDSLDSVQRRLGAVAAEVLTTDGVLETISGSAGLLADRFEAVADVVMLAEPAISLLAKGFEALSYPTKLLADAGKGVTATLREMIPFLGDEAEASDESKKAAEDLTWAFGDLDARERKLTATIDAHRQAREAEAAAARRGMADAIKANDEAERDRKLVEDALAKAGRGKDSIRRNIDELRAAERIARAEMNKTEEAVATASEGSAYYTSKVRAAAQASQEWMQLQGAIEGEEARLRGSFVETSAAVVEYTDNFRELQYAVGQLARDYLPVMWQGLEEGSDLLLRQAPAVAALTSRLQRYGGIAARVLDRVSDGWSRVNGKLADSRDAQEALDAATQKRNAAVWAGVEGASEIAKTIAQNAWVDAILGAALETAKGLGTAIENPAESVSHFAAAAQYIIAQGLASANGGGGSGGTGGAGAAAAPSSAPPSVADRAEREDVRGDSAYTIEVDGEVLGRVAARSVNKAARRGTAVLDRRATSTRNGRRGLT